MSEAKLKNAIKELVKNALSKEVNIEKMKIYTIEEIYGKYYDVIDKGDGVYFIGEYEEKIEKLEEKICNEARKGKYKGKEILYSGRKFEQLKNKLENGDGTIFYIGKAKRGNSGNENGLRERIAEYIEWGYGNTKISPHSGGRAIWQISNNKKLGICWLTEKEIGDAEEAERKLLIEYKEKNVDSRKKKYLPLANWKI